MQTDGLRIVFASFVEKRGNESIESFNEFFLLKQQKNVNETYLGHGSLFYNLQRNEAVQRNGLNSVKWNR